MPPIAMRRPSIDAPSRARSRRAAARVRRCVARAAGAPRRRARAVQVGRRERPRDLFGPAAAGERQGRDRQRAAAAGQSERRAGPREQGSRAEEAADSSAPRSEEGREDARSQQQRSRTAPTRAAQMRHLRSRTSAIVIRYQREGRARRRSTTPRGESAAAERAADRASTAG